MLQSVRNIFNQIGTPMNSLHSRLHKLSNCHELRKHLSSKNFICPTITAYQFNNYPNDPHDVNVHVMVATGMTTKIIDGKTEDFVQCKNSYRNDLSIPGIDWRIPLEYISRSAVIPVKILFLSICISDIIDIPLNNKIDPKHFQGWRFYFPNVQIRQLSAFYITFVNWVSFNWTTNKLHLKFIIFEVFVMYRGLISW